MADQRIAESRSTDVPLREDRLDGDPVDEPLPTDDDHEAEHGEAEHGTAGTQRPADDAEGRDARSAPPGVPASPRRVRLPAVLGLEGQEARILELLEAIGRRIRRRPLPALAVGVGIGFVVGGALSFRAGRLLLAAGARRAGRELLKQLL
jgi:hypothetical protein